MFPGDVGVEEVEPGACDARTLSLVLPPVPTRKAASSAPMSISIGGFFRVCCGKGKGRSAFASQKRLGQRAVTSHFFKMARGRRCARATYRDRSMAAMIVRSIRMSRDGVFRTFSFLGSSLRGLR